MNRLLSQMLLDLLLESSLDTPFGRVRNRLLKGLRSLLVSIGDPLVRYDLFKARLLLPLSHNLPLIREKYPGYSTNIGRIAKYVNQKYPSLKIVDIGANIGDTVAILRHYIDCPILCVEGSSEYFNILELNVAQFESVYISNSFVGNINDSMKATLISNNQGTARLIAGGSEITIRKLGRILDDFPGFKDTKMIKVDTDGMDGLILRGAFDVIESAHPVIFFEYDPFFFEQYEDDSLSLFADLKKLGYKTALVYDNYGEYMLSFFLDNVDLAEDLYLYCLGHEGAKYYDICVFHKEDADLAHTIRLDELSFFYSIKRGKEHATRGRWNCI